MIVQNATASCLDNIVVSANEYSPRKINTQIIVSTSMDKAQRRAFRRLKRRLKNKDISYTTEREKNTGCTYNFDEKFFEVDLQECNDYNAPISTIERFALMSIQADNPREEVRMTIRSYHLRTEMSFIVHLAGTMKSRGIPYTINIVDDKVTHGQYPAD